MSTINITNARKNLYKLVKEINDSHNTVHIKGKNGSAVIIAEEDWKVISRNSEFIPGSGSATGNRIKLIKDNHAWYVFPGAFKKFANSPGGFSFYPA